MKADSDKLFNWVQRVSDVVLQYDNTPLSGGGKAFPWEELAAVLAKTFEIDQVSFGEVSTGWHVPKEYFKGIGKGAAQIGFSLIPLEGSGILAFSKADLARLANLLTTKGSQRLIIDDPQVEEGLVQFFALEALQALGKLSVFSGLSPQLLEEPSPPEKAALVLDVPLHIGKEVVSVRLILSPELQKGWKQRKMKEGPSILSSELAAKLQMDIGLEVGRTEFSLTQWDEIREGDCLLLDECSWEPDDNRYRVKLSCNGVPLLRGKIKDGNLKILETPVIAEG